MNKNGRIEATACVYPTLNGGKSGVFLAGTKSNNKTAEPLEACHQQPQNKWCKFTAFVQI